MVVLGDSLLLTVLGQLLCWEIASEGFKAAFECSSACPSYAALQQLALVVLELPMTLDECKRPCAVCAGLHQQWGFEQRAVCAGDSSVLTLTKSLVKARSLLLPFTAW